jgi:hypothetical protein
MAMAAVVVRRLEVLRLLDVEQREVLCAVVALALLLQPVLYLPMAVLTAFRWQVVAAGTANIAVLCMVLVLNMMVRPLLYLYLPSATLTALPRTLPA